LQRRRLLYGQLMSNGELSPLGTKDRALDGMLRQIVTAVYRAGDNQYGLEAAEIETLVKTAPEVPAAYVTLYEFAIAQACWYAVAQACWYAARSR